MKKKWLKWAQEIQSYAQAGIEYSGNPFDIARYEQLRRIAVEIVAEYTDMDTEKVYALFANEKGYQTPKVDIRGVVYKDGKLLFVKENDGKWALPGGWAEPGLSISENAKKEVFEEAGITVVARGIIAILDRNKYSPDDFPYAVYKVFVECAYVSGSFVQNIETSEAKFFAAAEIPELSETRNTKRQIEMCLKHIKDNSGITLFD